MRTTNKIVMFVGIIAMMFSSIYGYAVPATPYPIRVVQPDGTELMIRLHGDERFSYATTLDNFLIEKNDLGYYVYLTINRNDEIVKSSFIARNQDERTAKENDFLKSLPADLIQKYSEKSNKIRLKSQGAVKDISPSQHFPRTGSPKSLVILVNFSDKSFVVSDPQTTFNALLNEEGYTKNYSVGSAKDYYKAASNGQFTPQFDVYGPYTLPHTLQYYGGDMDGIRDYPHGMDMITDACSLAVANNVDLTQYDTDNDGVLDNVFVYYAGNAQSETNVKEDVWPKQGYLDTVIGGVKISSFACTSELRGAGSLPELICGIGTFVHEFAHVLGMPDYYYTGFGTQQELTAGQWSVMDMGSHLNEGRNPPMFSAYDRFFLGWHQPQLLADSINFELDLTHSYIMSAAPYDINNPLDPTEMFLLENRQQTEWDEYLPGHGLLIWHIQYDSVKWARNTPNNTVPQAMEVVRADGNPSLATYPGDPFPGSGKKTSYNPTFRTSSSTSRPITQIAEIDGMIFGKIKGGEPDSLMVSQDSIFPGAYTGLTQDVYVASSNIWTAVADHDWIIVKDTNIKDGNLAVTVKANNTGAERIGRVFFAVSNPKNALDVKGDTLVVVQAMTTDAYIVANKDTAVISGESEQNATSVIVEASAAWTASTDADWLSITPNSSNDAYVEMNITASNFNRTSQPRYGKVYLSSGSLHDTIIVAQEVVVVGMPGVIALGASAEIRTAVIVGMLTTTGNGEITECGVYCSNSPMPQIGIGGTKFVGRLSNDTIYTELTNLNPTTVYYYKVFATNSAGMVYNSDRPKFTTGKEVGNKEAFENMISIYPNPAKDKLTINAEQLNVKTIQLYNISGVLMKEIIDVQGLVEVSLKGLPRGMYYVQVNTDNNIIVKKLIKE